MAETIKKNVRDFTIGEVADICRESSCSTCPLKYTTLCKIGFSPLYLNDEEEIEIDVTEDNTEYETIKCPACNAVVTQIKAERK